MKILIAGGSGFIGSALIPILKKNHQITLLGRNLPCNNETISWQKLNSVNGYDLVINLAGENIGQKRWDDKRKKLILESRVTTTSRLASLCAIANDPKPRLLNASAIGIYGSQQENEIDVPSIFDESSDVNFNSPPDFLAKIATAWEQAALPAVQAGCDVTWLRFGVVLDKHGGMLKKLLPIYKIGLGGIIGSGNQIMTWISLIDVLSAIEFIIKERIRGPICLVAPNAVTQRFFALSLAKHLHRSCMLHLPEFLIRILFGEMGTELLLKGQHVRPTLLQQLGFKFQAPTLEEALDSTI